jgi:hypothetical protein
LKSARAPSVGFWPDTASRGAPLPWPTAVSPSESGDAPADAAGLSGPAADRLAEVAAGLPGAVSLLLWVADGRVRVLWCGGGLE